jgi:hypothetical protein
MAAGRPAARDLPLMATVAVLETAAALVMAAAEVEARDASAVKLLCFLFWSAAIHRRFG